MGLEAVVNLLLLIGILLDTVFQWVILGVSHPCAALVPSQHANIAYYAGPSPSCTRSPGATR